MALDPLNDEEAARIVGGDWHESHGLYDLPCLTIDQRGPVCPDRH
jgi:hypothetical protein